MQLQGTGRQFPRPANFPFSARTVVSSAKRSVLARQILAMPQMFHREKPVGASYSQLHTALPSYRDRIVCRFTRGSCFPVLDGT